MMKRNLCLFLAAVLALGLLSGCSGTAQDAVSAQPSVEAAAPEGQQPEQALAPQTEPEAPGASEPPEAEQQPEEAPPVAEPVLPLCQQTETLSFWYAWPPPLAAIMDSPDGNLFYTELENRTNVHIDWKIVSTETLTETFNLMVISGEAPDMVQGGASSYIGGADKAVEDDFIIDCCQYLAEMPSLSAILSDPEIENAVLTPENRLAEIPMINDEPEGTAGGLVCRADWLEELGLEIPHTYDEYYDVLSAFKTEKEASAALLIPYTGFLNANNLFAGYGLVGAIGSSAFIVNDGAVEFTPADENFGACVRTLAKWYKDGLIDQDFMARTDFRDPSSELIYGNQAAMWDCNASSMAMYCEKGGFTLTAVPNAWQDDKGTDFLIPNMGLTGSGIAISTNCENPELACRWIDYLFSDEGSFLCNYGIEGETFNYDENGEPVLADLILANPDGLPFSLAQCVYICSNVPYHCHWRKLWALYTDTEISAYNMWNDYDVNSTRHAYPTTAVLNSLESEELSEIMGDVETYLSEVFLSVMVGEAPESKLDEIPGQLKSMKIDRAIEIKQAAYDRAME